MSKRHEILKQASAFALGSQLAQLITLVAAILTRRFLGPIQMGVWTTLQIVVEYSKYTVLGVTTAMTREIPYALGKGQPEKAEEIKDIVFSFTLLTGLLVFVGIVLFAVLTKGWFSREITYGLMFVSVIIFLQRLNNIYISLLRCYKEFALAGKQLVWSALVNALLVAVLGYSFKIYGFMLALILSLVFNIVYIHYHRHWKFRWTLDFPALRPLMAYGFPLMMAAVLMTLLRSLDKILIARQLGFEALGFYSLGLMVFSFIASFSNSVGIVLFPHFQEKFGVRDNHQDLKSYLFKSSIGYALLMPMIIGPVWTLLPFMVSIFLPRFTPGIPAMQYLSFSLYFVALVEPLQHFLITIKKHMVLFPAMGSALLVSWLGISYCISAGWGISGVAWSMAATFLIYFSALFAAVGPMVFKGGEVLKIYSILMAPLFYLAGVLVLIRSFSAFIAPGFQSAVIQTLGLGVFLAPLFYFLDRQFHLIHHLKAKFFLRSYAATS